MKYNLIPFTNENRAAINIKIEMPKTCPICHEKMYPSVASKTSYNTKLKHNIAILFQCTSCSRYFSSEYAVGDFNTNIAGYESIKKNNTPTIKIKYDLPEELDAISEQFKEIYTQSLTAEENHLTEISGIGYRKSIEFLVKDFLINFIKHTDSEKIKKMPLLQAIKKIDNDKIVSLATASAWLGNDEAHYFQKFEDKDVKDMKRFIKALTFYVSSEVVAAEAEEMINN